MTKTFLIEVEEVLLVSQTGEILQKIKKPVGLQTDDNGKYILENGEKIYFEFTVDKSFVGSTIVIE